MPLVDRKKMLRSVRRIHLEHQPVSLPATRYACAWRIPLQDAQDPCIVSLVHPLTLCSTEREVKKANRDLSQLLSNMESMPNKVDTLQRKYSELLAEMKRTEREHIKSKKRGDQLQKEKDSQRSELTKSNSMKEKLEKLSRELTKENKKLKVRIQTTPTHGVLATIRV